MKTLHVVHLYAMAEENTSVMKLAIPIAALNYQMAILAAVLHVTNMGMLVTNVDDSVACFNPSTGIWKYT